MCIFLSFTETSTLIKHSTVKSCEQQRGATDNSDSLFYDNIFEQYSMAQVWVDAILMHDWLYKLVSLVLYISNNHDMSSMAFTFAIRYVSPFSIYRSGWFVYTLSLPPHMMLMRWHFVYVDKPREANIDIERKLSAFKRRKRKEKKNTFILINAWIDNTVLNSLWLVNNGWFYKL